MAQSEVILLQDLAQKINFYYSIVRKAFLLTLHIFLHIIQRYSKAMMACNVNLNSFFRLKLLHSFGVIQFDLGGKKLKDLYILDIGQPPSIALLITKFYSLLNLNFCAQKIHQFLTVWPIAVLLVIVAKTQFTAYDISVWFAEISICARSVKRKSVTPNIGWYDSLNRSAKM